MFLAKSFQEENSVGEHSKNKGGYSSSEKKERIKKMTRIFYVDVAKSITDKEGKKYWKCSVVENKQNIINFANSKAIWAVEAEAFAIMKTVFWLVEQKKQGEVIIYTDNIHAFNNQQSKCSIEQAKSNWQKGKTTKALYFIQLSKETAKKNNIQLTVKWIKGQDNPADYYSRWNNGKYKH